MEKQGIQATPTGKACEGRLVTQAKAVGTVKRLARGRWPALAGDAAES